MAFSLSPASPVLYLYLAGLATPTVAAILVTPRATRRAWLRKALSAPRGGPRVYLVALVAQLAILGVASTATALVAPSPLSRLAFPSGMGLLVVGQLWVVFGEELGWRGFALPRLLGALGPRRATLALALVWGVWHAPMFFVAGSLQAGVSPWLFGSSILGWSAVHTWLWQRAGPSVVPNLVFHGSANITLTLWPRGAEIEPYLLGTYLLVAALALASGGNRPPPRPVG